uniref:Uncharacterized protein n=1 Tax=Glossina austeni TaxID=7395 RepID=A0A1A9VUA0_GLOAU
MKLFNVETDNDNDDDDDDDDNVIASLRDNMSERAEGKLLKNFFSCCCAGFTSSKMIAFIMFSETACANTWNDFEALKTKAHFAKARYLHEEINRAQTNEEVFCECIVKVKAEQHVPRRCNLLRLDNS